MIQPAMKAKREEAARWFAVLRRGVITHEERQAYDRWRRDPANLSTMAELRELWVDLEEIRDQLPLVGQSGSWSVPKTPRMARSVGAAALASVAASLVVALLVDLNSPWWTSLDWWSR